MTGRFDPDTLDLPERVVRYLTHALAPGAILSRGVRLEVRGRIRAGAWLAFDSVWEGDGRSFSWRATAGPGPLRPLRVHDRFADGAGCMDIRLRPGLKLLHAEDEDVTRSGAGRAALEAMWAPMALLPEREIEWRAEADDLIVATWDVPPERPEVHIRIDGRGAVTEVSALRWRDARAGYVRFAATMQSERSFGTLTIPSRLRAGWDGEEPFFDAEVTGARLLA